MKTFISTTTPTYETPQVEVMEFNVEQGFAASKDGTPGDLSRGGRHEL